MNTKLLIQATWRRRAWLFSTLTPRKLFNLGLGSIQFAFRSDRVRSWPAIVKLDISPVCNLACTICLHADPNGNDQIGGIQFNAKQRMTIPQYQRIIDEIKGKSTAVSLYVWGDPLTHPDLNEMCSIAADAGLQVHISTNFSFKLSDERLKGLLTSGLTHLTVCVDGLSQQKYEQTRVGGRIDWVLDNLERACRIRKKCGSRNPLIEVQYIRFPHNVDEVEAARERCESFGVDEFVSFWGALHNYTDWDPGSYQVKSPFEASRIPRCYWPYFSMVIKYDGEVIPCCEYRRGPQYTPGADSRVLGNVFETSVREVWNAESYRMARRMVVNPASLEREPAQKDHFCHGCPVLYETNAEDNKRIAPDHRWEDLYDLDDKGRPVRRPETIAAASSLLQIDKG